MKFSKLTCCVIALSTLGLSGLTASATRTLELVSYGQPIGEVQVVVGAESAATVNVDLLPTGVGVPIGSGSRVELRQKTQTAKGVERWARIADADLPTDANELLAVMVPLREPDTTGARHRVVVLPLANSPTAGSYTLVNLTPVPVTAQLGAESAPVEIAPWTQRAFSPKTDKKFRALLNVAYRTPGGEWVPVRSGVVVLPPDQATYGRVVVSPNGTTGLGGGRTPDAARPTVLILETKRPANVR